MGVEILKDERNIYKKDGKVIMEFNHIEEMDQSNVNHMIDAWKDKNSGTKNFISDFSTKLKKAELQAMKLMTDQRRIAFEYVRDMKSKPDEEKIQIGLDLLEEKIKEKKYFVKDFDDQVLEMKKKLIEEFSKMKQQALDDEKSSRNGLNLWENYYDDSLKKKTD